MNRHRKRLFGDAVLKIFETTPASGETQAAEYDRDWTAHRVEPTTNAVGVDSGEWQFEIAAAEDWKTAETFMNRVVAITVDERRWKINKVEEPIGHSLVWKIKAEVQK